MPIEQSRLLALIQSGEALAEWRNNIISLVQRIAESDPENQALADLSLFVQAEPLNPNHLFVLYSERQKYNSTFKKNQSTKNSMRRIRSGLGPSASPSEVRSALADRNIAKGEAGARRRASPQEDYSKPPSNWNQTRARLIADGADPKKIPPPIEEASTLRARAQQIASEVDAMESGLWEGLGLGEASDQDQT